MVTSKSTTRPRKHSRKITEELCSRIEQGQTLEEICQEADMPERTTVNRWRRENETFRTRYEQALRDRADLFADQMLDLVDNCPTGPNEVQKSKLRIDVRKLIMARDNPETYKEKNQAEGSVTISFADLVKELEERDGHRTLSPETE